MSSLEWLLDLCAVADAAGDGVATDGPSQDKALPPSQDPWYTAPDGFESKQPGDVLRIRSVPKLVSVVEKSSAVYHILYRSTDSRGQASWAVTTLFIPSWFYRSQTGKAAVLSYQFAYNTANFDCSPSFALAGVMAKSEPTLGIRASTFLLTEMLSLGWIINTPDHLGPTAAFGASIQSGHATLDSLRAVHNLLKLRQGPGFNTAISGYSGGSIATFAAAELHSSYAPDVNIHGAVLGGVVDEISADLDKINKSPLAGTLIALLLGITSQYPEARAYLESRLVEDTKDEFMSVLHTEVTQAVKHFAGKDIYSFFENGVADLRVPQMQDLYDSEARLGYRDVPTIPMFVYKAIEDQFCPIKLTDATIERLCSAGAEITYERNTVGGHVSEIENGKPRVFRFLESIFDETYQTPASKRNVSDVTVDVSPHTP
ncbi:secretory lipase-domain-containing protein [Fusarium acuminatum]|uniref:Secretory lipase-domain-containing protein n=1 Tax=Fusarium acuminatum TaxID=5515 RepID=A0ABZ2X9I0_9HYPO